MVDRDILNKIKAGMWVRVKEKRDKGEGIFEGLVIARKHGQEQGASFTVRKVIDEIGVEKTYPLWSPLIDIQILKEYKTKRAKLYWVREKSERKLRKRLHESHKRGTS